MNALLGFCAGILALILLILVRGRIIERRWWEQRRAALERANEKFLNRGERRRRQLRRAGR